MDITTNTKCNQNCCRSTEIDKNITPLLKRLNTKELYNSTQLYKAEFQKTNSESLDT